MSEGFSRGCFFWKEGGCVSEGIFLEEGGDIIGILWSSKCKLRS